MIAAIEEQPENALVDVDLETRTMARGNGARVTFEVPAFRHEALLRGDDEIAATMRYNADIAAFVDGDRARQPWIHRAIAKDKTE